MGTMNPANQPQRGCDHKFIDSAVCLKCGIGIEELKQQTWPRCSTCLTHHNTQAECPQDVEKWKRELIAAGWIAETPTRWRDLQGSLYRGPFNAWRELRLQTETP